MRNLLVMSGALVLTAGVSAAQTADDPFHWLEDVQGEKALAWAQGAQREDDRRPRGAAGVQADLRRGRWRSWTRRRRSRRPSSSATPSTTSGRTTQHERGIWRRTTLASYRTAAPAVGDGDRRRRAREGRGQGLGVGRRELPAARERRAAWSRLSRGGCDASVVARVRRDDEEVRRGGFSLPEAKSRVAWRDENTLWVGTDFGPGSLTTSGYPRIVKLWKRGTPARRARRPSSRARRRTSPSAGYTRDPDATGATTSSRDAGVLPPGDLPPARRPARQARRARRTRAAGIFRDRHARSRCAATGRSAARRTARARCSRSRSTTSSAASATSTCSSSRARACRSPASSSTKDRILIRRSTTCAASSPRSPSRTAPGRASEIPLPGLGTARHCRPRTTDGVAYFFTYTGLPRPRLALPRRERRERRTRSRPMPAFFDATGMKIEQFEATSKDGTKIPYFVVTPKGVQGRRDARRRCSTATAASRSPRFPATAASSARRGSSAAASTCSRTSAAAASSAPRGTRRRVKEQHIHNFEDFSAVARGPDRAQDHLAAAPRHHGRLAGRPARRRDAARSTRSSSTRSSRRCRSPTCGGSATSSPARAGWPSTATRTSPRTGPTSRRGRRTRS